VSVDGSLHRLWSFLLAPATPTASPSLPLLASSSPRSLVMARRTNLLPPPGSTKRSRGNWHLRVPLRVSTRTAIKNHFVAAVGEYVGTTLFLFFALGGTNVANIPSGESISSRATLTVSAPHLTQLPLSSVSITDSVNTSQIQFIALSFGFSLAVNA
jgi:hypothetical protein